MDYEQMKARILAKAEELRPELVKLNDDIADHPELSGREYETQKKLVRLLQQHGYQTEAPFSGIETAFRAVYGENNHTHKAAILVEYDALPEIGHACGHCLSGCISLLAALALRDLQDELDTDIHLIGTPNEEDYGAKCIMEINGVFRDYDMAIMTHMLDKNIVRPKILGVMECDYVFHGKAAHASGAPWEGKNALNGAQLMLHAVDMLRQHVKPDSQFHAVIRDGGRFPNIVPERAEIQMFIRSSGRKYMRELLRLVDDCARGAAIATQTTVERKPENEFHYVDLRSNPAGEAAIREVFGELGLVENAPPDFIFGSSDIGNVSYSCPAFQPTLQVIDNTAIHTREFAAAMKTERAHTALGTGACLLALSIAKIFSDENRLAAMKEDFLRTED